MNEILSDTKQTLTGTEQSLSHTKQLTAHITREELATWLAAPNPSTNQNQVVEKRLEGTCHWFLQLQKYTEWKTGNRPFLWLHGKSGSGKSTICSAVIDALEAEGSSSPQDGQVIYFYFDFRDPESKQSHEKMLRCLIRQLSARNEKVQELLRDSYSSHDSGNREPLTEDLCSLFKDMIQHLTRVHIIIDALDECITRDDVG